MKKNLLRTFLILLIGVTTTFGQGELFNKGMAKSKFGPVQSKIRFNSQALLKFIEHRDYLLFGMDKSNSRVNILDKHRTSLFNQYEIKKEDVYHVYDTQKIAELIKMGGEKDTYIEKREKVISISNGVYVLEIALPCPPCCPLCPGWPDWPPEDD